MDNGPRKTTKDELNRSKKTGEKFEALLRAIGTGVVKDTKRSHDCFVRTIYATAKVTEELEQAGLKNQRYCLRECVKQWSTTCMEKAVRKWRSHDDFKKGFAMRLTILNETIAEWARRRQIADTPGSFDGILYEPNEDEAEKERDE